jgi:hypothetical protein
LGLAATTAATPAILLSLPHVLLITQYAGKSPRSPAHLVTPSPALKALRARNAGTVVQSSKLSLYLPVLSRYSGAERQ